MNVKRLLALAAVSTLLWTDVQAASLIFANQAEQTTTISATENTGIQAGYHSHLENQEWKIHFQLKQPLDITKITLQWQEETTKKEKVLSKTDGDLYEVRIPQAELSVDTFVDIVVETRTKESLHFKKLSLKQEEDVVTSEEMLTATEEAGTSILATSSEEPAPQLDLSTELTSETTTEETTSEELPTTQTLTTVEETTTETTTTTEETSVSTEGTSTGTKSQATTTSTPKTTTARTENATTTSVETTLYRLYHPGLRVHLYTKDTNEYRVLAGRGWKQEGEAWKIVAKQGTIVYRLYHPGLRVHLYTKDTNEYKVLASRGWRQEGEAYRSYGNLPIYRLYHPRLKVHLYTKDTNEYNVLASRGWKQEGIAFYGLGSPTTTSKQSSSTSLKKASGQISISNINHQKGRFDAIVTNLSGSSTIQSVQLAVWSETAGQDDLKWYTATKQRNGSYQVTISKEAHKNSIGHYQVHLYYQYTNGQSEGISSTRTQLEPKIATIQTVAGNNNQQLFTISNVDAGFEQVKLAVWSTTSGQDDLKWYTATKQANGQYQVSVPLKNHNFEIGQYQAHLYGSNQAQSIYLGQSPFTVSKIEALQPTTVNVLGVNSLQGTLNVVVNEPINSKKIKEIRVAAWSDSNQNNLAWYNVQPTGNLTTIPVSVNRHYFKTGNYTVHAYVTYTDNSSLGFDLGQHFLQGVNNNLAKVFNLASSMVGVRGGSPEHKKLVDDYNSVLPRPVGYVAKYTDNWCDIFVTTIFQRAGLSVLIGRECGVERHIQIFKTMGIWIEDGTITPKPGDIITFNWDSTVQPNSGFADHIGIVEYVDGGYIHTIEGNGNNEVVRRTYRIGHGNIRGFARPRY